MQQQLQNSINQITTYSGVYRIGLNAGKAAHIFFLGIRHTSEKNIKHVTINNINISIHNKVKFLGVTFDSSLSFTTYTHQINCNQSQSSHHAPTHHLPPVIRSISNHHDSLMQNIRAPTFRIRSHRHHHRIIQNINICEDIQYRYIKNILDLPHISKATVAKFGNLPFINHRLLHLSKAWYNKAITHNTSIEHFIDNHVSKHPIRNKYKTPYTILTTQT